MKKIYQKPAIEAYSVKTTSILDASTPSASFGSGTTDGMGARGNINIFYNEDVFGDEQ